MGSTSSREKFFVWADFMFFWAFSQQNFRCRFVLAGRKLRQTLKALKINRFAVVGLLDGFGLHES
jgi:hypothetical protein